MFPGTSFQLLSLPPRLYLFPYLSLFSTLLYFSRILKRKPSRWKQVERTRVSNSCALQPFTISIHDTLVSSLLSSSRSLEGKRRNAQTGRIWTRTGHEEEKRREEKREQATGTLPAHGTRFCLSGRRAGRLITVAFCGFVARHDPRAFRGPHCSASNRSRNGAERSFFVGELVDSRVRRCCPFTRRVHRRHNLRHFLFVPLLRFIVARNYRAR